MKALIALALLAPTTQTGAPPCIAPAEVKHATLFLMPAVLDGLTEQCRPSLAPNAYLLTAGLERSKTLATDRNLHWNAARAAIVRLAGEEKAGALGADTAALLIRDVIRAEGSKQIKPADCAALDRAMSLLAPLPPENIAELVALAAETGLRAAEEKMAAAAKAGGKGPKGPPIAVCPSATATP